MTRVELDRAMGLVALGESAQTEERLGALFERALADYQEAARKWGPQLAPYGLLLDAEKSLWLYSDRGFLFGMAYSPMPCAELGRHYRSDVDGAHAILVQVVNHTHALVEYPR